MSDRPGIRASALVIRDSPKRSTNPQLQFGSRKNEGIAEGFDRGQPERELLDRHGEHNLLSAANVVRTDINTRERFLLFQ